MTEERMIRVTLEKGDFITGHITKYDKWGHAREIDIDELELAPSPDFKPKCYYESVTVMERDWDNLILEDRWKCVSCDIREKCIYKRE